MLLDELSNPDFGWPLVGRFDDWELGRTAVRIVGGFPMLRGFAADGVVICSDENFVRLCERPSTEPVQFGLLKVATTTGPRSSDAAAACATSCPPTSCPIPAREILARETDHWVEPDVDRQAVRLRRARRHDRGLRGVYQVLSNDVREHLPEYATLKAMGYTNRFLAGVVVRQSLIYADRSYLIAVILGLVSTGRPRRWPASRCG